MATASNKKAPRLHEVLAVESDLEGTAKKLIAEASSTFSKKSEHFMGYHKRLMMFDEKRRNEESGSEEHKEIVETVVGKLSYVEKSCIRWIDALLQKESANQEAKADLVVDGETIIEDVPATWLLGMESRLKLIREMYANIPTLAPGVSWVEDKNKGKHIFKSEHTEVKDKTEQVVQHQVIVPATKEHPAQVSTWQGNKKVGVFELDKWTGMVSPATKSNYLERIDKLIRGCKKARQRANQVEVKKLAVAKKIFEYING
jgi:hypothetical protein